MQSKSFRSERLFGVQRDYQIGLPGHHSSGMGVGPPSVHLRMEATP